MIWKTLPDRESNPGLPRDRRGYSPLYYRGLHNAKFRWFFLGVKLWNHERFSFQKSLSRVAQRKRAGPITQRSVDRNHPLLHTHFRTFSLFQNIAQGRFSSLRSYARLNGLVVWFSLWVREAPGSNPGWARKFLREFEHCTFSVFGIRQNCRFYRDLNSDRWIQSPEC